jgi:translation elongation factor EF-Ts
VDRHSVPAEVLQHERQVLSAQAAGSGKPEAVIAKV